MGVHEKIRELLRVSMATASDLIGTQSDYTYIYLFSEHKLIYKIGCQRVYKQNGQIKHKGIISTSDSAVSFFEFFVPCPENENTDEAYYKKISCLIEELIPELIKVHKEGSVDLTILVSCLQGHFFFICASRGYRRSKA